MVESKAFLENPKHQYHVSQGGENDYAAHNKKNRYYYRYLSLSQFKKNFDYKENDGKKSFSCKSKPLISWFPIKGTWL